MKVTAVVPTFNRCAEIHKLCSLMLSMHLPEGISFSIVCVVDGSTDGTIETLSQNFPSVHIVRGTGKWWYTRSMNEGFKYALSHLNPDTFLCINDDVEVEPDYLTNLINAYLSKGGNCLMGSVSLSIEEPHVITFSGTRAESKFPYQWKPYIKAMSEVDKASLTGIFSSKELPGRGLLIPVSILKELNFMDDNFPQYHSDFDLCLRASKRGYKVFVSYDAILFSHVFKTSNSTTYKRIATREFLKNFFNPYSRKHLGQNARYIWRHKVKLLFPIYYAKWFALVLFNHLRVNIIKSGGI